MKNQFVLSVNFQVMDLSLYKVQNLIKAGVIRCQNSLPKVRPKISGLLSLPFLLFITLPLIAIFWRTSLTDLTVHLGQTQVVNAISVSLITSLISTLLSVIFGTPVAYLLARREVAYRQIIDTLIDLPTVLPPAVAGVALLMAFGRRGLVGHWFDDFGIHIAFTQIAVILAQSFVAAPLYIKAATLGFKSINPELEDAAALDGANSWQIFRYITVPLAWAALLSGCVMTWARALGEFGATIIFAGNYPGKTQTMPLAIYLGFELDLSVALTLSVILVGCSFGVLMVVKGLLRHKLEL